MRSMRPHSAVQRFAEPIIDTKLQVSKVWRQIRDQGVYFTEMNHGKLNETSFNRIRVIAWS